MSHEEFAELIWKLSRVAVTDRSEIVLTFKEGTTISVRPFPVPCNRPTEDSIDEDS